MAFAIAGLKYGGLLFEKYKIKRAESKEPVAEPVSVLANILVRIPYYFPPHKIVAGLRFGTFEHKYCVVAVKINNHVPRILFTFDESDSDIAHLKKTCSHRLDLQFFVIKELACSKSGWSKYSKQESEMKSAVISLEAIYKLMLLSEFKNDATNYCEYLCYCFVRLGYIRALYIKKHIQTPQIEGTVNNGLLYSTKTENGFVPEFSDYMVNSDIIWYIYDERYELYDIGFKTGYDCGN